MKIKMAIIFIILLVGCNKSTVKFDNSIINTNISNKIKLEKTEEIKEDRTKVPNGYKLEVNDKGEYRSTITAVEVSSPNASDLINHREIGTKEFAISKSWEFYDFKKEQAERQKGWKEVN